MGNSLTIKDIEKLLTKGAVKLRDLGNLVENPNVDEVKEIEPDPLKPELKRYEVRLNNDKIFWVFLEI